MGVKFEMNIMLDQRYNEQFLGDKNFQILQYSNTALLSTDQYEKQDEDVLKRLSYGWSSNNDVRVRNAT